MTSASSVQAWMAELLRSERDLSHRGDLRDAIRERITGSARLSPEQQLEIYREQFWLRHTASLLEDFPGLSGILGQAHWEHLAESYLTHYAPRSWTLRDLGSQLPAHVAACTGLPHHDVCVDMARLEWAFIEIFDAPDAPRLDPDRLARIPQDAWKGARIVLNPALRLLRARYPVAELRRRLREAGNAPVRVPDARPQHLVLYRGQDLSLYHRDVSPGAFELLRALDRGLSLVDACEQALRAQPDAQQHVLSSVGEWFADFGRRGWVVDVLTDPASEGVDPA